MITSQFQKNVNAVINYRRPGTKINGELPALTLAMKTQLVISTLMAFVICNLAAYLKFVNWSL